MLRRHGDDDDDDNNDDDDDDDDSDCGDHRRDDDGDDDVALAIETLRRDALRRRRWKGGRGRGALIADTADDYEDQYRRRRTPHRISLNRVMGIILARPRLPFDHTSHHEGEEHFPATRRVHGTIHPGVP